jgi:excisionase family DNA binding protein
MERYTTIAGETIEYETPSHDIAAFLARLFDAAHDPSVTESAMVELIYGSGNPVLRQDIIPGRGVVTKEVFQNPLYQVMTDLLGVKRIQLGTLDPEAARDEYTITVTEAAERLGVHPSAVRQAIAAGRLDAVKRGHQHLIRPHALESFKVARKKSIPRTALRARVGNDEQGSFRFRVAGGELEETGRKGRRIDGVVRSWTKAWVISGGASSNYRFFELTPSDEENEVAWGPFFVKGRFSVAKENNARRAHEKWRESARQVGKKQLGNDGEN